MTEEKRTVHIVGGLCDYIKMFVNNGWMGVDNVEDADLVQFCGGADVNPALYGEQQHYTTNFSNERDAYETAVYKLALLEGCAIAGICRGAQFVHVMNEGKLYQNVNNHAIAGGHHAHIVVFRLDHLAPKGFQVSSTHHQMMRKGAGEVIVSSSESTRKETGRGTTHYGTSPDIEAVFHKGSRSLCYQPHPEFFSKDHRCQSLYFEKNRSEEHTSELQSR